MEIKKSELYENENLVQIINSNEKYKSLFDNICNETRSEPHNAANFNLFQKLIFFSKNNESLTNFLIENILIFSHEINIPGSWGYTPFMVACMYSNIKIVELLIDNGAKINHLDKYLDNALILSSSYANGNENDEIMEFLIKKGINTNTFNEFGQNAFMNICHFSNIHIANILLENNTNINEQSIQDDTTSLMQMCEYQNIKMVEFLLKNGADPNLKDCNGDTALFYVLTSKESNDKYKIINLLLKYGAYVNTVDNKNKSLLENLIKYNPKSVSIKSIKILLEKNGGAFLNKLPKPLNIEFEKLLIDYGFSFV